MIVHVSSQAAPGEREAGCPCSKSECGRAVLEYDERNLRTGGPCKWHGQSPVAPFKGWHRAEDCPDAPVEDAPLVVRGVIQAARPVAAEEIPLGLKHFVAAVVKAGWEVFDWHYAEGELIERRLGPHPEGDPEGERHYIDEAVTIQSVVVRMNKGHAKLVAVYENGRARAGWRRRTWASNWEDVGMKALRSWAVGQ